MSAVLTLVPRVEPVTAWQYDAGAGADVPTWVERRGLFKVDDDGPLFLFESDGGRVVMRPGEWLVKQLDGVVTLWGDLELWRAFKKVA